MISFCPRPLLDFEGDGGVNVGVADVVDDDGLCEGCSCVADVTEELAELP